MSLNMDYRFTAILIVLIIALTFLGAPNGW